MEWALPLISQAKEWSEGSAEVMLVPADDGRKRYNT